MRSRTGCQTCRQRKLKCDEEKPVCGQCRKGSRECQPSAGVIFRHQQNASLNGSEDVDAEGEGGRLGSFFAYKDTFDENNVWVDVPKNVTFYNVTDPYNMEETPDPENSSLVHPQPPATASRDVEDSPMNNYVQSFEEAPGLEALSTAAASNYEYSGPLLRPTHCNDDVHSPSNNLNYILNPPRSEDLASASPATTNRGSKTRFLEHQHVIEDHEVAFLMRHYSEAAGKWMDLFDLGCYFGNLVPVQALFNPLLKYSACAYAAKQLGRVAGSKASMMGLGSRQTDMESFTDVQAVDWTLIGAKYYDLAITLLLEELSRSAGQNVPDTPIESIEKSVSPHFSGQSPEAVRIVSENEHHQMSQPQPSHSSSDESLAAGAILCVYEFLDHANSEWSRHLSGTKSLFDLVDREGMLPMQSPSTPGAVAQRVIPSRARRAAFWNFARQDFLAAFINESQTRLNTADLGLWRAAGLLLDDYGFVIPSKSEDSQYPDRSMVMHEDMMSNALIFLMSKIINYLASGDSVDHVFPQDRASPSGMIGINQMILLERWQELEKELEVWYQGLPVTFQPCARLSPITDGSVSEGSPRAYFSEIWYSMAMCASTMQSYHMARILLLVNRPHESTARRTTLSERLQSYRAIELQVRHHSHEIVGIALSRPDSAVRINQVQPLFVAGQCLTDNRERQILLDTLRAVEIDLGWATDYRMKRLIKEWGWDEGT